MLFDDGQVFPEERSDSVRSVRDPLPSASLAQSPHTSDPHLQARRILEQTPERVLKELRLLASRPDQTGVSAWREYREREREAKQRQSQRGLS
jgi:hypothetical protein